MSRPALFFKIPVFSLNVESLANILSSATPTTIPTAVKTLYLISARKDEDYVKFSRCLLVVLNHFKTFDTLEIRYLDFPRLSPQCTEVLLDAGESYGTKKMILKGVIFNRLQELTRLVAKSPSLNFLDIGDVEFAENAAEEASSVVHSIKSLVLWDTKAFSIAPFLLQQPCASSLEMIVAVCHNNDSLKNIQSLTTKSTSTLKQLAFEYGGSALSEPLDLSQNTNLMNLSFDICRCVRIESNVAHLNKSVLSLPPLQNFKELVIHCGEPAEIDISEIDRYLTSKGAFPNFRQVTLLMFINLEAPWVSMAVMIGRLESSLEGGLRDLEKWGKERFPLCAEKGWIKGSKHWGECTEQPFGNLLYRS